MNFNSIFSITTVHKPLEALTATLKRDRKSDTLPLVEITDAPVTSGDHANLQSPVVYLKKSHSVRSSYSKDVVLKDGESSTDPKGGFLGPMDISNPEDSLDTPMDTSISDDPLGAYMTLNGTSDRNEGRGTVGHDYDHGNSEPKDQETSSVVSDNIYESVDEDYTKL